MYHPAFMLVILVVYSRTALAADNPPTTTQTTIHSNGTDFVCKECLHTIPAGSPGSCDKAENFNVTKCKEKLATSGADFACGTEWLSNGQFNRMCLLSTALNGTNGCFVQKLAGRELYTGGSPEVQYCVCSNSSCDPPAPVKGPGSAKAIDGAHSQQGIGLGVLTMGLLAYSLTTEG